MLRNVKIKAIIYRFLHVCGPRLSLGGRKAGEIDGQRGDLLAIKTTSNHLHYRVLDITGLIGVHDSGKDFGIEAVNYRDALVDTFLTMAGNALT